MANAFQMTLLEAYPGIGILPIDPTDVADVDRAVKGDDVGDTLFEFLWTELGKAGSVEEFEAMVAGAVSEIWDLMVAIRNQPERTDFRAMLCETSLRGSLLDADMNDLDSVQEAIDADPTRDLLFTFLWRELEDMEDSPAAADELSKAIDEIGEVRRAIYESLVPGTGPKH